MGRCFENRVAWRDAKPASLVGSREHHPSAIEKETDKSSPVLYLAAARGLTPRPAEPKGYRINEAGREEEYFNTLMHDVKVVSISPRVPNITEQRRREGRAREK